MITPLFAILLFTTAQAQDNPNLPGGYFATYTGAGPLADDGGILFGINLSGGYQRSKWLGFGGSLGAHLGIENFSSSFSGFSLQYRIRPVKRLVFSFDYGYIFRHSHSTDASVSEYIAEWNPFFKFHAGWKAGSLFTLGLGFVGLPQVRYKECVSFDSTTNTCAPVFISKEIWPTSGVLFTLGLNFN